MKEQRCPNCQAENAPEYRFCQRCGVQLTGTPSMATSMERRDVQSATQTNASAVNIPQLGSEARGFMAIWQPFAGYGYRGRHVPWLLSALGYRAEELLQEVSSRFNQRQIPGATIVKRVLSGRGLLVERRQYHFVQRKRVTVGLYIARFGEDLYISQVTYAKGQISPLRLLVLGLMVLFQLGSVVALILALGGINLLSEMDNISEQLVNLGSIFCCFGPLWVVNGLALTGAAYYMLYHFITDRDLFMLLRSRPNEFQQDDVIALEKAVEETVRQSLDAIGIARALMPEAPEYGIRRRLI